MAFPEVEVVDDETLKLNRWMLTQRQMKKRAKLSESPNQSIGRSSICLATRQKDARAKTCTCYIED